MKDVSCESGWHAHGLEQMGVIQCIPYPKHAPYLRARSLHGTCAQDLIRTCYCVTCTYTWSVLTRHLVHVGLSGTFVLMQARDLRFP